MIKIRFPTLLNRMRRKRLSKRWYAIYFNDAFSIWKHCSTRLIFISDPNVSTRGRNNAPASPVSVSYTTGHHANIKNIGCAARGGKKWKSDNHLTIPLDTYGGHPHLFKATSGPKVIKSIPKLGDDIWLSSIFVRVIKILQYDSYS